MKMGSRVLSLLKGPLPGNRYSFFNHPKISPRVHEFSTKGTAKTTNSFSLEPPDVSRLAETARITLTPDEVEEFEPKIRQVIDWFGQLQAADLSGVEPAIRADSESDHLRDDVPETFENSEGIVAAVPGYEEPYIKVPKVLNSE